MVRDLEIGDIRGDFLFAIIPEPLAKIAQRLELILRPVFITAPVNVTFRAFEDHSPRQSLETSIIG